MSSSSSSSSKNSSSSSSSSSSSASSSAAAASAAKDKDAEDQKAAKILLIQALYDKKANVHSSAKVLEHAVPLLEHFHKLKYYFHSDEAERKTLMAWFDSMLQCQRKREPHCKADCESALKYALESQRARDEAEEKEYLRRHLAAKAANALANKLAAEKEMKEYLAARAIRQSEHGGKKEITITIAHNRFLPYSVKTYTVSTSMTVGGLIDLITKGVPRRQVMRPTDTDTGMRMMYYSSLNTTPGNVTLSDETATLSEYDIIEGDRLIYNFCGVVITEAEVAMLRSVSILDK